MSIEVNNTMRETHAGMGLKETKRRARTHLGALWKASWRRCYLKIRKRLAWQRAGVDVGRGRGRQMNISARGCEILQGCLHAVGRRQAPGKRSEGLQRRAGGHKRPRWALCRARRGPAHNRLCWPREGSLQGTGREQACV